MRKVVRKIVAGTGCILLCAALHAAEITCLTPARDATIFGGVGFDNTADGAGPHLWTSVTNGGFTRRALLYFDVSVVPVGSVITAAELSLTQSRSFSTHPVTVHRVVSSWTEGPANAGNSGAGASASASDVTWRHRSFPSILWASAGADSSAAPSSSLVVDAGSGALRLTWPATPQMAADVQAWLDAPSNNHGWILIGDEVDGQKGKRFDSRENGIPANRPCLRIQFETSTTDIPLPAWALWLMALGLIAAFCGHTRSRTD